MSDAPPSVFTVDCSTGIVVERPMNTDELAQHQADAAESAVAAVEEVRTSLVASIHLALSSSDKWCARHVEDAVSLTPDRIVYRQQLRDALAQAIDPLVNPLSVIVPDLPEFVPLPKPAP